MHDELRSKKIPDHIRIVGHGKEIEHHPKSGKIILRFCSQTNIQVPGTQ